MKTEPTSSISGSAGMPLAYEAVQSGRNAIANSNLKTKPKDSISDTLETTDREGDGRQILDLRLDSSQTEAPPPETQDRLDLTG